MRLARVHDASPVQALLLVLVGLADGQVPHQLMNGLETGLMLAAVTWALALASEPGRMGPGDDGRPAHRGAWLPCLCGVLPFIRPDLVPLSLGLLGLLVGRHVCGAEGWHGGAVRPVLHDLGLAVLCAAPWALWYGVSLALAIPVPWRPSASSSPKPAGPHQGADRLEAPDLFRRRPGPGDAQHPAAGAHGRRAGLLFALALVATYFLHFPDALGFYEGRCLYSLLPLVLYGAASAFKVWPRGTRPVLRAAVTGLLAAALVQFYWRAPDFWARHQSYCGFTRHDLAGTGVSKLNRQRNRRRARAVSGTRD